MQLPLLPQQAPPPAFPPCTPLSAARAGARSCCVSRRRSGLVRSVVAKTPLTAQTPLRLAELAAEVAALPEGQERMALLLRYAAALPALPEGLRSLETRVMGCTSQTWLSLGLAPDGTVRLAGAWPPVPGPCPLPFLPPRSGQRLRSHTRLRCAAGGGPPRRHTRTAGRGACPGRRLCPPAHPSLSSIPRCPPPSAWAPLW